MGFAGFLGGIIGVLLCVLSANGRLQPTIAAMFGQAQPGATPTGGWSSDPGQAGPGSAGGWGSLIGGILGGGANWGGNTGQGSGGGGSGGGGDGGDPGGSGIGQGGNAGPVGGRSQTAILRRNISQTFYEEG